MRNQHLFTKDVNFRELFLKRRDDATLNTSVSLRLRVNKSGPLMQSGRLLLHITTGTQWFHAKCSVSQILFNPVFLSFLFSSTSWDFNHFHSTFILDKLGISQFT